ncbi:MAG: DUF4367 domain-containing protein [Oscillospiraceae bacterium]|nr:DUF4367 domain-containing protein [Oscillospiraceae bacterium]
MELNDLLLKDALLDAAEDEFAHILDGDSPEVAFSNKYLARRRRFLKAPSGVKPWQKIAVQAAIVVLVLFSLMVSAQFTVFAEAKELQRMEKVYKDHLTYIHTRDYSPTTDAGDWYISALPDGFTELKADDAGDFCSIHYVNGTELIELVYFHTSAYMNISMEGGNYNIEPCTVNGEAAIFHNIESTQVNTKAALVDDAVNDVTSGVLMWFSEDGEMVFMLEAALPMEDMVKIAESVILR